MAEKVFQSRTIQKHDTAANWAKATGFSPFAGEVVVYLPDENCAYPRIKIGDGVTNVNDLPFADGYVTEQIEEIPQSDWNQNDENAADYVKNRTHWIEGDMVELTPACTSYEEFETALTEPLVVGETYTFILDGVPDVQVALDNSDNGYTCGYIGYNLPAWSVAEGWEGPYILRTVIDPDGALSVQVDTYKSFNTIQLFKGQRTVHTLPEEYIPSTITRTADIAQSDWGQNDETAKDYVKGRTHWNYVEYVDIPECSLQEVKEEIGNRTLIDGETYTVIIDGVEGTYVAHKPNDAYTCIGTADFYSWVVWEFSGWIMLTSEGGKCSIDFSTGSEHTFAIKGNMRAYRPLTKVYMPTNVFVSVSDARITGSLLMNCPSNCEHGMKATALGYSCEPLGDYTVAEGYETVAKADVSHTEGCETIAASIYQHAQGKCNIEDANDEYAHIVGNGTASYNRSNAHTLDWSGNAWFAGDVYVGSTSGTNRDDGSKKLATEDFVTAALTALGLPVPTVDDAGKILRVNAEGKYELTVIPNAEEATF